MQTDRLFEITYILLERKMVTAQELAAHFEISTRTVYRDIEKLSQAGIPVYMSKGKGGGISILPGFVLDKAVLKDVEKQNILSSIKAVDALTPLDKSSELSKINAMLGDHFTDWIEIDFSSWSYIKDEKQKFQILKQAILEKYVVSFSYANVNGEQAERFAEPLKLGFKGQAWYLYAYCRTRQAYRFFKLVRMQNLKMIPESFDKNTPSQIFFEETPPLVENVTLCLKLSPKMAYRAYEEFSSVQQTKDGSFLVNVTYPKSIWLLSYIASFGKDCEILSPKSIRDEFRDELQKILEKYL